ncbi:MAG: hypothetical protein GEV05_22510 [Betaproteobacteria bacterium]|nr:hypothetical protein [Betaproteobacteria bacterium]
MNSDANGYSRPERISTLDIGVARRTHGDLMDAIELLLGRTSALKLQEPGPSQTDLEIIFKSALRAPDHGRRRPWRFIVIKEDKRERFGELLSLP